MSWAESSPNAAIGGQPGSLNFIVRQLPDFFEEATSETTHSSTANGSAPPDEAADLINPATEDTIAPVLSASEADVDHVLAAGAARPNATGGQTRRISGRVCHGEWRGSLGPTTTVWPIS
jgi:hypothetical protein